MTIAPTTSVPNGPSAPAARAEGAKSKVSSDYDTFLRMLTAQIRNQDPLNPIQSSDYAVQLATFSGVEQQVKTNDLLGDLARRLAGSDIAGLAGWVGREVKAAAPVRFDGAGPVKLAIEPEPRADQAVLVTLDAAGEEVARQPVPAVAGDFAWTGTLAGGGALPAGDYSFRLDSYRAGSPVGEGKDVSAFRAVIEVRLGAAGAEVVLSDGATVPAADVTAIRG